MKSAGILTGCALAGLGAGLALAWNVDASISEERSVYLVVALVITMETLFHGLKLYLEERFDLRTTLLNFGVNLLAAFFFLKIGFLTHVDFYMALFIIFGMRMFSNLSALSQKLFANPSV
ncbi:MAG: DUF1290 domain-containing protein [Vampirovibrionales bacterium]|nr:DUF1290 domain-containing protein [Vampirovibrionales bacterium]